MLLDCRSCSLMPSCLIVQSLSVVSLGHLHSVFLLSGVMPLPFGRSFAPHTGSGKGIVVAHRQRPCTVVPLPSIALAGLLICIMHITYL